MAALVLAGLTAYTIVTMNSGSFTGQGGISEITWLLVQATFGLTGALIVAQRSDHIVGWMLSTVGIGLPLAGLVAAFADGLEVGHASRNFGPFLSPPW